MFCALKIVVFLSLREKIYFPIEFAPLRIFCRFVFTLTSCVLLLGLIEGKECP